MRLERAPERREQPEPDPRRHPQSRGDKAFVLYPSCCVFLSLYSNSKPVLKNKNVPNCFQYNLEIHF